MSGSDFSVSAVITAYNEEDLLPRALDSVFAQKRLPSEVIVIDDGSTDATAEVARARPEGVIYRRQENGGCAAARNLGITTATSEWIALLDADDTWLPDHLDRCWATISNDPSLVWCHAAYVRITGGKAEPSPPPEHWQQLPTTHGDTVDFFDAYLAGAPIGSCGMVLKKSVLESMDLFDPEMRRGQDRDLWFRIALLHPRMGYVWPPTVKYIYNERSVTAQRIDSTDRFLQRLKKHADYLPELNAQTAQSFERILRALAQEVLWHSLNVARPDSLRRLLDEYAWLLSRRERQIAWWGARAPSKWLRILSNLRLRISGTQPRAKTSPVRGDG